MDLFYTHSHQNPRARAGGTIRFGERMLPPVMVWPTWDFWVEGFGTCDSSYQSAEQEAHWKCGITPASQRIQRLVLWELSAPPTHEPAPPQDQQQAWCTESRACQLSDRRATETLGCLTPVTSDLCSWASRARPRWLQGHSQRAI